MTVTTDQTAGYILNWIGAAGRTFRIPPASDRDCPLWSDGEITRDAWLAAVDVLDRLGLVSVTTGIHLGDDAPSLYVRREECAAIRSEVV